MQICYLGPGLLSTVSVRIGFIYEQQSLVATFLATPVVVDVAYESLLTPESIDIH